MKQERGITLVALIIYVLVITFIVAGVSAITTSFYGNMNSMNQTSKSAVAYSRFNMYFLNDIKSSNVAVLSSDTSSLTLSMTDDKGKVKTVEYSLKDGSLYRDKVRVCDKISELEFKTSGKRVTVYIKFANYERTTNYMLEPKEMIDDTTII